MLLWGVAAALAFTLIAIVRPIALRDLDLIGYDVLLRSIDREPPVSNAVIVDIDEASLKQEGQWPWPRYKLARLIDSIRELEAAGIGLDIVLAEPDGKSLAAIAETYRRDHGMELDFGPLSPEQLDNDALLANSIHRSAAITCMWLSFGDELPRKGACPPPLAIGRIVGGQGTSKDYILEASHALCPTDEIAAAVDGTGFLNALPDLDNKLRRMPLVIQYDGQVYPSLALALLLRSTGVSNYDIVCSPLGVQCIRAGRREIPTDAHGNLLLRYSGSMRHAPYVSASDVLSGNVSRSDLAGKIVLVGSSAVSLRDVHATPFSRAVPGVELHAIAVNNMLQGDYLNQPGWTRQAEVVAVLLLCLFTAVSVAALPLVISRVGFLVGMAAIWFGSQYTLANYGLYLPPVPMMAALASSFVLLSIIRFRLEEKQAYRRARDLSAAQSYAISGLTALAETRDPETGRHIIRTQRYVKELADYLARQKKFRRVLTKDDVELMPRCAPLHDIGKVGVPDHILLKPGKLTDEEFEQMKQHTTHGYEVLKRAEIASGASERIPFLRMACEIALTHHEKWDGTGYPQGLAGEAIPMCGRIMALADVYDALTSLRCYKPPMPHEKAANILKEGRGKHFDPDVLDAFLALENEFQEIAVKYGDKEDDSL
ncbi:MAG: hypothetical protein AMXMBFR84_23700 [Candidatus Hydrogenedentota bacterium]